MHDLEASMLGAPLPAPTAMALVRKAQAGEVDHDHLVAWLKVWPYEPTYRPTGLADDGELRDNSLDAVQAAYTVYDLISIEECKQILDHPRTSSDPGRL